MSTIFRMSVLYYLALLKTTQNSGVGLLLTQFFFPFCFKQKFPFFGFFLSSFGELRVAHDCLGLLYLVKEKKKNGVCLLCVCEHLFVLDNMRRTNTIEETPLLVVVVALPTTSTVRLNISSLFLFGLSVRLWFLISLSLVLLCPLI